MAPKHLCVLGVFSILPLVAGCTTPGANLQANVYRADQVNSQQEAKVVKILLVTPARIEVDNSQNKRTAEVVGGLLGAIGGGVIGNNTGHASGGATLGVAAGGVTGLAAGSLVPGKVLVDGVSITYEDQGRTFNSAQVGRVCEFTSGKAVVISTSANETRIQPNATCPSVTARS